MTKDTALCLLMGGVLELDKEVELTVVHATIRSLEGGTAAGLDGALHELLRNAGFAAEVALVALFNITSRSLAWPLDWHMVYIMPLFKGDGSRLDPGNNSLLSYLW